MIKSTISKIKSSKYKIIVKIVMAVTCVAATYGFLNYYPAPAKFESKNTLQITLATLFIFSTISSLLLIAVKTKKAILFAIPLTSLLFILEARIITIIAYAICVPLIIIEFKKKQN